MTLEKVCVLCGTTYPKPYWISQTNWELRKYCSRKCLDNSKIGNHFHTGHKHSKEARRKMSLANIGHTPWNKGKGDYAKKLGFGKWMTGKTLSIETRKKQSEANKRLVASGKHNFWKGGRTPEVKRIRTSLEYKLWRESVYKRDDWTCQECGARSGQGKKVVLNADHIKPFSQFPELRFDINNGRTLCVPCHKKTPTYMGRIFKGLKLK